jgi:hypothetical protein
VETETDLPLDKNPHRHVDIVDRSPGPNGVPDQGLSAVLLALAAAPLLGLHCRSRRKPAHTRLTLS